MIQSSAELLYGLIHQRYIITKPGLVQMVTSPLPSNSTERK